MSYVIEVTFEKPLDSPRMGLVTRGTNHVIRWRNFQPLTSWGKEGRQMLSSWLMVHNLINRAYVTMPHKALTAPRLCGHVEVLQGEGAPRGQEGLHLPHSLPM